MPPESSRILFLSVSAGAGHGRAAEALRVVAEKRHGAQTRHWDVMDHVPSTFKKLYTEYYLRLVDKFPAIWAQIYRITDQTPPDATMARLRRAIERLNARSLRLAIEEFAPHAIVCTHFLPAELLQRERRRGRLATPTFVQVTDFDLHSLWVVPELDGYFAASDEVAYRMRARGLPADRVHVTGIPIMPVFSQPHLRAECAREYRLNPDLPTLLLMGGGAGVGALDEAAEKLLHIERDFQLVALAGKNAAMLDRLSQLAGRYPGKLIPQGYTNRIERLMGAADLAISKPGGLTTSECLAMGLPMIVFSPIPGQEERNCDYLLEHGAALKAVDAVALEYRVRKLLENRAALTRMRDRAKTLGKPAAAVAVMEQVVAGL
ncbi:MGDG synthase family glycosyltransferase [Tahibacter amnicola]|uniref:Glycosyltransferase n=1 Tax=Tahibacter amnicola TaxID=2976241 RepID=A0ABY6BHH5_9GAMM|nr:glycosyltransferase [Tahibacter amnicola]UXI67825.1 glycosyltransferase [Tahibacter amnicola]